MRGQVLEHRSKLAQRPGDWGRPFGRVSRVSRPHRAAQAHRVQRVPYGDGFRPAWRNALTHEPSVQSNQDFARRKVRHAAESTRRPFSDEVIAVVQEPGQRGSRGRVLQTVHDFDRAGLPSRRESGDRGNDRRQDGGADLQKFCNGIIRHLVGWVVQLRDERFEVGRLHGVGRDAIDSATGMRRVIASDRGAGARAAELAGRRILRLFRPSSAAPGRCCGGPSTDTRRRRR